MNNKKLNVNNYNIGVIMQKSSKIRKKLLIKKYSFEAILIILGSMIMAIGTALFLLPNQLSSGGFSGVATIPYYFFKWSVGATILILNIPCFILAYIRLGKEIFFKSLLGTASLSIFIDVFDKYQALTSDKFLACLYGGIIIGFGTSIILKANASTGGSDLVSYIIKSYKPTLSTSNLIVGFDVFVIALNVIFFKKLEIGLYSAIAIYLMGKVIDIIFEGIGFSKIIYIVSEKYDKISKRILEELKRGTTGIYSKGMYKSSEKIMLMCIVSRREVGKVKSIVNKIDKQAFLVISNAREVYGKGFKRK